MAPAVARLAGWICGGHYGQKRGCGQTWLCLFCADAIAEHWASLYSAL